MSDTGGAQSGTPPRPKAGGMAAFVAAGLALAVATPFALAHGGLAAWAAAAGLAGLALALARAAVVERRRGREREADLARLAGRIEEAQDRIWLLSESLARQRDLIDAQGDAIVRRDAEGRLTFANDAFCRVFGLERDQVLGTTAMPAPLDPAGAGDPAALSRPAFDARFLTSEGVRWFQWQDTPIRDAAGRIIEVQSVGRDITVRKDTEEALRRARDAAEEASRAKSRFLAAVSHEIRTPMNGIIGMADLLLDTGLTPEQTTYASAVHSSAGALLGLIDEILDFSRIEAGRLELADAPFSLAKVVADVAELLAPRAAEKGLEVAAFVARGVPAAVRGDADRLRQVLVNLAANGIKFTDRGGVLIEVRRGADDGAGASGILIAVRDTGVGIPADAASRIFEEFEQADAGPARRHGGAGLGLAICRRIVTAMGGSITVESRRGRGSAFLVRLPLAAGPAADRPGALRGRRILLASPSPVLRLALEATLRDEGAQVRTAAREGTLARRLEEGTRFDSVLVDLPFADSLDPRRLPAIVLLSPRDRAALPELTGRGFAGYLIKPIRSQSLLARLGVAGGRAGLPAAMPAPEEQAGPALSVLLAEDNDLNAMLTEALLRRLGHRVTRVRDGLQAVKKIRYARERGEPYDLALMDIHMPDLDGLSAAREVRTIERESPAGGRIFMIALTANAFAEDQEACLEAGMDMFLAKPVDREALAEGLRRIAPAPRPGRSRKARGA